MPKLLASFAIAGLCAVGSSLVLAADLPPSKRELVRDDERNCLCFGPWDRNLYRQVSLIGGGGENEVGELAIVDGDVSLLARKGFSHAALGDRVQIGDRVLAGEKGNATIVFNRACHVKLLPGSELEVREVRQNLCVRLLAPDNIPDDFEAIFPAPVALLPLVGVGAGGIGAVGAVKIITTSPSTPSPSPPPLPVSP